MQDSLLQHPADAGIRELNLAVPPPSLTVEKWLETRNGIILPERGNAFPGPLQLWRTPYLRKPLQLFTDPHIERMGLCFARQVAKTTFLITCLGYVIDYDPGSALMLYPIENLCKTMSKDRIRPIIRTSPALRQHLTGDPDDFTLLQYTLDRMTVRFAWGGSEMSGRSLPIRYLFKDESSALTASASANADDTTSTFWNRKIIETSTPLHDKDNIWRFMGLEHDPALRGEDLWNVSAWKPTSATTAYFHWVPCPHCGKYIILEWSQLRWPPDIPIREIPAKAWYECQRCRGVIRDGHKPDMLAKGRWRSPNPGGRWVGLHLSSLYSPFDSCRFGMIARDGLRAKKSRDPEVIGRFVNNRLALPYTLEQEAIDLVTEESFTVQRTAFMYKRNELPKGVKVLTMGIDVGKGTASGVHWVIRGWGAEGTSWLIAWNRCDNLHEMEMYLRTQAIFHHPAGMDMTVRVGAADSRYNKPEVVRFCKLFRGRIVAVQGERRILAPDKASILPWRVYHVERDARGKPLIGSMLGYRINTVYWKQWLYARLNPAQDQEPAFFFPMERDPVLERHLQSEQEILIRSRGTAKYERAWVTKDGYEANHYLDAMVYSIAIADVARYLGLTKKSAIMTGIQEKPKSGEKSKPRQTYKTQKY